MVAPMHPFFSRQASRAGAFAKGCGRGRSSQGDSVRHGPTMTGEILFVSNKQWPSIDAAAIDRRIKPDRCQRQLCPCPPSGLIASKDLAVAGWAWLLFDTDVDNHDDSGMLRSKRNC